MDTIQLTHSLFATNENFVVDNTEFEMEHYLVQTEAFLVENENIYGKFTDVQEGVLGDIWYVIKDIAKKAVQFVIWLFKSAIKLVKKVIKKIVTFFLGDDKKTPVKRIHTKPEKKTIKLIALESAQIREYSYLTEEELKSIAIKNCNFVMKKLDHLSRVQVDAAKKMDRYVDKQKHAISESLIFVDEAKRLKGREIMNASMIKRADQEYDLDEVFSQHNSLREKDYAEMKARDDVASVDINRLAAVLYGRSKDIIAKYNMLIEEDVSKWLYTGNYWLNDARNANDRSRLGLHSSVLKALQDKGLSPDEITSFIKGHMFIETTDPEVIKRLITLRLNYCDKCRKLLLEILKINYKLLKISKYEADIATQDILQGKSSTIMDSIRLDNFLVRPGFYDFRPLSKEWQNGNKIPNALPGCVFYPENGEKNIQTKRDHKKWFNLALKYDAVVVGHGSTKDKTVFDVDPDSEEYKKHNREFRNFFSENGPHYSINHKFSAYIEKLEEKYDIYLFNPCNVKSEHIHERIEREMNRIKNKEKNYGTITDDERIELLNLYEEYKNVKREILRLRKQGNTFSHREEYWSIEAIETENHPISEDVNQIIRNLIEEGHKRIMLTSCNVGHHKLADDIMKKPGIVVNYQDNIMYG